MLEFIKSNWFSIVLSVLIFPAYKGIKSAIENGIAKIPERLHEQRMEEIRKENSLFLQRDGQQSARNLQVDNYYRSISGKKIEDLFSEWMDIIADTSKSANLSTKELTKMIKELMMYGSAHSVHLGSIFMQYIYQLAQISQITTHLC